jgi:hypothetical protein
MTDEYEHEPFLRGGKLDVVWTDSTLSLPFLGQPSLFSLTASRIRLVEDGAEAIIAYEGASCYLDNLVEQSLLRYKPRMEHGNVPHQSRPGLIESIRSLSY